MTSWSDGKPIDWQTIIGEYRAAWEREQALPPLGSPARPFELVVPAWVEERAREQGTTCQEIADRTFCVSVDVKVVEPLDADPA